MCMRSYSRQLRSNYGLMRWPGALLLSRYHDEAERWQVEGLWRIVGIRGGWWAAVLSSVSGDLPVLCTALVSMHGVLSSRAA